MVGATLIFLLCIVRHAAAQARHEMPDSIALHHDLRYREGKSEAWKLDLAYPKGQGTKPRPALVVIHGGGWIEGDKSSFTSLKYWAPGNIIDFAKLGFVAATINYRLSREAPFPAALEDCKCAVRWLRAHAEEYHIDVNHIGAYGNSAGGHLALLSAWWTSRTAWRVTDLTGTSPAWSRLLSAIRVPSIWIGGNQKIAAWQK
jgi:acetyl esterase/lipase